MIKGDLLAACALRILPANEKQEMVAEEIFHTSLTNKKQEKL
jgi:hypothetical protein